MPLAPPEVTFRKCVGTCDVVKVDTHLLASAEFDLRQLSDEKKYAYITYQDLRSIPMYRGQTVMAIKAPPEAQLQVPPPDDVSTYRRTDR